jgi:hypothetical protein
MNRGISGGADLGLSQRSKSFTPISVSGLVAILVLAFLAGAYCGAIITNNVATKVVMNECNKYQSNSTIRQSGLFPDTNGSINIQFEPNYPIYQRKQE